MKNVKLLLVIAAIVVCVGIAFAGGFGGGAVNRNIDEEIQKQKLIQEDRIRRQQEEVRSQALSQAESVPAASRRTVTQTRAAATPLRNELARVLVIPTPAAKRPEIAAVKEDLAIMSRILDRAIDSINIETVPYEGTDDSQRLIALIAPGGLRQNLTDSIYIYGYGAIFSMRVNFPIMPPPQRPQPQEGGQKEGNVWEQARQELYSSTPAGARGNTQEARIRRQEQLYEQRRVDELKGNLIEALKQASNIRGMKAEDSVTITITAPGVQPPRPLAELNAEKAKLQAELELFQKRYGGGAAVEIPPDLEQNIEQVPQEQRRIPTTPARPPAQPGQPTVPGGVLPEEVELFKLRAGGAAGAGQIRPAQVLAQNCLIIKAKKADIDEFAGGLTLEAFKKRLEIITY